MVKTKTYAPPKGGVGTNNVELSEESDADLLGQHDTTENESKPLDQQITIIYYHGNDKSAK
jgi:hypothetical protein